MDLHSKGMATEEEVRSVAQKIEQLVNTINELKKEEAEVQSKMSKVDEEIQSHKQHKKFLDLIAIAAGEKKPVNQKKRL